VLVDVRPVQADRVAVAWAGAEDGDAGGLELLAGLRGALVVALLLAAPGQLVGPAGRADRLLEPLVPGLVVDELEQRGRVGHGDLAGVHLLAGRVREFRELEPAADGGDRAAGRLRDLGLGVAGEGEQLLVGLGLLDR
jgi:hypothetical protein